MATQTESKAPPEITIISRVASIPLIEDTLGAIHTTLTNNTYTRQTYTTAQGVSKYALSYAEPLQKTFSPLIVRADGLANKTLDAVESRYPYPFKTHAGDLVKDLRGKSDEAYNVANKTIDERVKTPAYNVAQGIDQRIAPIVDYFEVAVNKISPNGTPTEHQSSETQFQYQRALAISKDLGGHLYVYSTEHINQLKEQNALVQRAAETAHNISVVATSSLGAAHARVHTLSDTMLVELQKIQTSTSQLPSTFQTSFHDISTHLAAIINDLTAILTSQDPVQEKVHKVRDTVQEGVQPLLEAATTRVQEILGAIKAGTAEKANGSGSNGSAAVNGNGHA
ncbi:lipid droplet-associated perilipin protein [Sparassis latifolia]